MEYGYLDLVWSGRNHRAVFVQGNSDLGHCASNVKIK